MNMTIFVILYVQQDSLYMHPYVSVFPTWCPVSVCFPVLLSHPSLLSPSKAPLTFSWLGQTSPVPSWFSTFSLPPLRFVSGCSWHRAVCCEDRQESLTPYTLAAVVWGLSWAGWPVAAWCGPPVWCSLPSTLLACLLVPQSVMWLPSVVQLATLCACLCHNQLTSKTGSSTLRLTGSAVTGTIWNAKHRKPFFATLQNLLQIVWLQNV